MPPNHNQPDGPLPVNSPAQHVPQKEHYRLVVMGSACVGKTAIISQFLYDSFVPAYKATIEELHCSEFDASGNRHLVLEILDTSGAYPFPAMRALSIARADAFVLVYAVDDEGSFDEVRNLREQILQDREAASTPIVVVGNKCDSVARQISRETAESTVCIDWEHGYVETSAKDNVNVAAVFHTLMLQVDVRVLPRLSQSERRRRSLPQSAGAPNKRKLLKRHSCSIS